MMKKMIIGAMAVVATVALSSASLLVENEKMTIEESTGSYFKIINDTSEKVKIHTGSGEVTLNPKGGSTSVSCKSSKSVKVNGKEIFKISEDLCDSTVKLSDYL